MSNEKVQYTYAEEWKEEIQKFSKIENEGSN